MFLSSCLSVSVSAYLRFFFVCRFMCLSFCLSVSVSACLRFFFVCVFMCLSVCSCLSITLGGRLTTRQPIVVSALFVFLSVNVCSCVCPMRVCPPVCLSVCLSVRCRDWLLVHLVLLSSAELLREMPLSLLEELLASPDLFVMQVEMDIYTMLKKVQCVLST